MLIQASKIILKNVFPKIILIKVYTKIKIELIAFNLLTFTNHTYSNILILQS